MILNLKRGLLKVPLPRSTTFGFSLLLLVTLLLGGADLALAACPSPPTFEGAEITHSTNINNSWVELCSTAARTSTIRLIVYNYDNDYDLDNMVITETLPNNMNYVTGSADITYVRNGGTPSISNENISGTTITWTLSGMLDSRFNSISSNYMYLEFEVYRSDEGLIDSTTNRTFAATFTFDARDENNGNFFCDDTDSSGNQVIPLHEPNPGVDKVGWNVDAGQSEGQATATVYGNNDDDVIWRLRFTNSGRAPLEDLIFDDTMAPGNMQVNYVCTSAADANDIADNDGAGPGSCYATYWNRDGNNPAVNNSILAFAVDPPYGDPPDDEIDIDESGITNIYLVGKLETDATCQASTTNTVDNIQWGCEADSPPDGGISQTSSGSSPGSDSTNLISRYGAIDSVLTVNRRLTGLNTGQPVGSRGLMTITITNDTGGTVKFSDTLAYHLKDTLPVEYVMDPTFTPTIAVVSTYGGYPGRIDTVNWTNPVAGTFPINTADATTYLNNTTPEFALSSSTSHTDAVTSTTYEDMLRQGDVVTITFRVLLIRSDYYDRSANLDETPETTITSTDPDPGSQITLSNTLEVQYDTLCPADGTETLTLLGNGNNNGTTSSGANNNIPADPEDLDIAIGGASFILTNDPTQLLTLPVIVTNNGGHYADDFHLFVTFGTTMDVLTSPTGCNQVLAPSSTPAVPDKWQPADWKVWVKDAVAPINIPSTSTVFECTSPATIAPGQSVTYNFDVRKTTNAARITIDDLTFRADIIGEIVLSDGTTPLWFPTPGIPVRADGELDLANNYSLDTVWARVIGFNLKKEQSGTCNENNPPTYDSNTFEEVQIGEECTYYIETGGWFGFNTPGFAYIAVQNVKLVDELEDPADYGQGYISSTDPLINSTSRIAGVSMNPPAPTPLQEGWIDWTFNVPDAEQINVADEWFRVYLTTRILNDQLNTRAAPNIHAADSHNILNSTFDATFENNNTGAIEKYTLGYDANLGINTIGYPLEPFRRVDLTVTEPLLTVVKEVCNEDLYGAGTGCSNFVTLADDGDAYDHYIYRLTVTNELTSGGAQRAPAYEVTVTDVLDASDLAYVLPFTTDNLNNDGDSITTDEAGTGDGTISDNIVKNVTPATLTFSYTHSDALLKINAGQSVWLYYRVDFDNDAAPLQTFTNSADATYDSLEGNYGSQTVVQSAGGTIGGARVYTSTPDTAQVQIIPVLTQPKRVTAVSNTPLAGSPQNVTIGEEIEYTVNTLLPVALLRNFVIHDELPAGLTCIEAPTIDLDAAPYNVAGFLPGGQFTPTCSSNLVEWDFEDQRVTNGNVGNRYDFEISFVARVDNIAANIDGDILTNGDPTTNTYVTYQDEAGSTITINFPEVDVRVREPLIDLTKTFSAAGGDGADILTVTVTATNNGTSTAYNLMVLDDLTGLNLTYIGNPGGADPPDNVDTTTLGANRPIFSWNPPNDIGVGNNITFTFQVQADDVVQPQEVLDNTIEARWTSLPNRNTALNSDGSIGPDGDAAGMRIGSVPNANDPVNDYESTASDFFTVPPVTINKTDLSPAQVPTIGAHKNFQIDINLPEGVTNGVLATDNLDTAVAGYLMENNATYDVTYTFQGIDTINTQLPGEAAFNSFPTDGTTGSAVWDIGTVVTATENDTASNSIDPLIRINYSVRINNDQTTNDGDTLQNSVDVNYDNGESGLTEMLTDNTAVVTVVEPTLSVSKTVSNATPGKNAGDPASGGDILEYTITVQNTGNSTAHDVNLVDTIPATVALYSGFFTPTATIGGAPAAGFIATPANSPDGPLVWGRDNSDDSLDIPAAQTLVLTYRIYVEETGGTLSNSVWVDWTSLDNANVYERTGSGCPTWTTPDDYCAGPATSTIATVDDNSFLKEITNDTYDVAPLSTAADKISRLGDIITYRLALNLRGGLTRNIQVQDVLPAGMAFVDTVSINFDSAGDYTPPTSGAGSNFSYSPVTAAAVPAGGQTGALTWTIGDVVNDPFGDPTTDTLEIIYRAATVPDSGIAHVATTNFTNNATFSYTGAAAQTSNDTFALRQPIISQVTKTERSGFTSPASVNVSTDIMQFRIEACNTTGQAPAYSAEVTDQLASQLDETSIANLQVSVGGSPLTAAVDYVYTPPAVRGGAMNFLLSAPINPGQCLIIDYDIGFHTDFGANQVWNNSGVLEGYWSLPAQSGQFYGPVGPAIFTMNNVANTEPPTKTIVSPLANEATIGEEIVYQLTVPGTPVNAAMYDIVITDSLDANLEYVSAAEISGNNFTLADNSVLPGQVSLAIDQVPAGRQAVIELHARLRNITSANAGSIFTNTAIYTYADSSGGAPIGGGNDTTAPILIVEPLLSLGKSVSNTSNPGNPPQAGDILRYTLTFTASGGAVGDNFSNAFDLSIDDTLSPGLAYNGNPTVSGAGNIIGAPVVTGDGTTVPQSLNWSPGNNNGDIDIPEGTVVTVDYDVLVLDSVLIGQSLANSAVAQWTGLDDPGIYERNGTGTPAVNDYFTGPATTTLIVPDNTSFAKTLLQETFAPTDGNVRIGDILDYELRLSLQEGTYTSVTVTDTLPQGLIFEEVVSVNGDTLAPYSAIAPFAHADIASTAIVAAGDPVTGPTTVTWTLGDIVNQADGNSANDEFVIVYRTRVLNDAHLQVNNIVLSNTALMDYNTAGGAAPPLTSSVNSALLQPNLLVSKSAVSAGGDTILAANEPVTYTIDITNNGSAPAYDPVLEDIIPLGMRNSGVNVISVQLLSGPVLPNLAPTYDSATGIATWDFDTGLADQYTIPGSDTLRIVYQIQADATIGAAMVLTNQARVTLYYSLDDEAIPGVGGVVGVRQVYGPTNTAVVTLTTALPDALDKLNPAATEVAVGEPFTYQIIVPTTLQATNLYDVRIIDDLTASAADISFVSVAKVFGTEPWTPVNTGTSTQLVIEDPTIGIDIPAGERIIIDVTVVLDDTSTNVSGLLFNNTATYTYNRVNDDPTTQEPGEPDTTADLTITGPDNLTLQKSGPVTLELASSGVFTLDLHNPSSGTAWNPTITDHLPLTPQGGMCSNAPANVTARIFASDGTTPVSPPLVEGTDFVVTFTTAPTCVWTVTLQSSAGGIGPDQHLIVTYEAMLDPGTFNAIALTNIAGVTSWFSADPATAVNPRSYAETLSDGTPLILDHEDNHELVTIAPVLVFRKTVVNSTTGQDPGSNASPGDTLHYTIEITNIGSVGLASFTLTDEVDRLNNPPLFAPGTLNLVSYPGTADASGTDLNGGANGSGLVDIANLSIDAQGGINDSLTIEFDITLVPVIDSGTEALNQARIDLGNSVFIDSDDPNVIGDENPTSTLITSAPAFEVWKTSQDLTDDPSVLMAGNTLRYTITVKNVGNENTVNMLLTDQIPANTAYVANSTTLNGAPVADPGPGVSPLRDGMPINAPEDPTQGAMRADTDPTAGNTATITFDVVIDIGVLDGTIIANQGYLTGSGAGSGPVPEEPSDDPDTATVDDPTRDVVGNLPLVDAQKTVQIVVDNGSPNILDPDDVIRYTITVTNSGAIPATGVIFTDTVPANTTYEPDTVTLNGLPVGLPDLGVSPLIAGIPVSSSDLTPPLPTSGNGVLSPLSSAVITFDVRVNLGVATGTIISNQGTITTAELPDEPTDSDGIDANGDQPTLIVVGNAQLLTITKDVSVIGGGTADGGSELEYVVRVSNPGTVPAINVTVTDDLGPLAGQVSYVAGSGTMNGAPAGVGFAGNILTADYAAQYGDLQPGSIITLRFRVLINPAVAIGTTITNTGTVRWNSPIQSDSASVSIDVGGTPGSAILNGNLWHDAGLDLVFDSTEQPLVGWLVQLYRNNSLVSSTLTDTGGVYRISGLTPNQGTPDTYELRFASPGVAANTASLGYADSIFTNGPQQITDIIVASGNNLQNLNLPIWPNGTIYNSVVRVPVAGARLTMLNAGSGSALPPGCFADPAQQDQVTTSNGFYKFDLNFSDPACPTGSAYLIEVTAPTTGYLPTPSLIIPPTSDANTGPLSVPTCPASVNDAVPATVNFCEAVASASVPPLSALPGSPGTRYHLHLTLSEVAVPGQSQIFNNPIPIDPELNGAVAISKTSPMINVSKGALVPYTITVTNVFGVPLYDIAIIDRFPAGFKYMAGSARLDGTPTEPRVNGRTLTWDGLSLEYNTRHTIRLLLVVGSGVSEGEYVNLARVFNTLTNTPASEEATATVRVVPDPDFDCTDVIGKVFDDRDLDGSQGTDEKGIPGVRVVTVRGLIATSDEHGRFHITCAAVPDSDRGGNFILKLDERSLPTGYRVTTENPRVQRATRGKMLRVNFGSTIHRVVALDIADGVFEPDSAEIRLQWQSRIPLLLEELRKSPAVLRLSYLADIERKSLVKKRLKALKKTIDEQWDGGYQLTIETKVFWRRGSPP